MTSDEFKQVEDAFARAVALEGDARARFVDEFAARRPALGPKLRRLLAADAVGADTLGAPVAASVKALSDGAADAMIGAMAGVWKIVKRIGAGGMGAVFLAERTDQQFTQTAAVKIMTAQLLDENSGARFRAERQILANLNHPNIATLIDGGATQSGLPFLVMEYVDGVRIDNYCDQHELPIERRLKLFTKVCEAVDYAHRNLVVHRDLKPSNILVTEDGEPKLLDFGIAKLIEPGAYEAALAVTRAGGRMMTPEYASPEQVRGEPVSVASDVYALGVLLFRLLTGQSPYGASATTPHDIERAILDADPQRPSTVVTQLISSDADEVSTPEALGRSRAVSPDRLRRRLAGDLDNIVLKCLQKDAQRRYANVRDLSNDIDRFLTNRPVIARGDDWFYKARKFARRNAQPLMAAGVLVVAIVGLSAYYTARLAEQRDRAELAAAKATAVSEFLANVFKSADPHSAKGDEITALELLAQAEARLDALDGQPELQGAMMQIIGDTYRSLGDSVRGQALLESSLALRADTIGAAPLAQAELFRDLSEAYRANEYYAAAEDYARRELAILERELPPDAPQFHYSYGRLAVILADQKRKAEAAEMVRRASEAKLAADPAPDSAYVDLIGNLAHMLVDTGRLKEAGAVHERVLRLSRDIDGDMHPNTLIRMGNYARYLTVCWRFEEAAAVYAEIIEKGGQVWSPEHGLVARWLGNRASVLGDLGRFDEARRDHLRSIAISVAADGEMSVRAMARERIYAGMLIDMGAFAEAEALLAGVYERAREEFGDEGYELANIEIQMARLANRQGDFASAEELLRRAMRASSNLSAQPRALAEQELAASLSGQGRHDEAIAAIEGVIASRLEAFGAEAAPMAGSYRVASDVYRRAGDVVRAVDYGARSDRLARAALPEGNWIAAQCSAAYAEALLAAGRGEEAAAMAVQAHAGLAAAFGADDPRVVAMRALIERR
ncbi:MAG: protein kinase [Parvularculaceae bacterium]|nr:protein kinase [Parvularculaceae bacterium]